MSSNETSDYEGADALTISTPPAERSPVTRKPKPKCARCRNHGIVIRIKDHKPVCCYRNCTCQDCNLTKMRQDVMKKQVALRRRQATDRRIGISRTGPLPALPVTRPENHPPENVYTPRPAPSSSVAPNSGFSPAAAIGSAVAQQHQQLLILNGNTMAYEPVQQWRTKQAAMESSTPPFPPYPASWLTASNNMSSPPVASTPGYTSPVDMPSQHTAYMSGVIQPVCTQHGSSINENKGEVPVTTEDTTNQTTTDAAIRQGVEMRQLANYQYWINSSTTYQM
uniref:Doublesex- and mab-3-related transcription factor C2-like n=1 Tax=Saccoglossus kowalevskii TaxID=10224 RepID=A0ABM0MP36_SACKO|nr:PREDICTED: doublesex- and mab-3-related transcription factor C2-like [Saccoglossus kowalevskii]